MKLHGQGRVRADVRGASNRRAALCASLLGATVASGLPSRATAQEEPGGSVDVITVTAQKREASIQDVPISVMAFSGRDLDRLNVSDLTDLSFYVPNFTIFSSVQQTNTRVQIRGVGSVGNTAVESSVGAFVDGVYMPRSGMILGSIHDLAAVEVLRGPQGTLFGRNTSVGALNIRTSDPGVEFESAIRVLAGNHEQMGVGGYLSGPLSDALGARIAFNYYGNGAIADNDFAGPKTDIGDRSELSVRGKLAWAPTDNFKAGLSVDYASLKSGVPLVEYKPDTITQAFVDRTQAIFGAPTLDDQAFDYSVNQSGTDDDDNEQYGASLQLDYDVGGFTLTSLTAIRDWRDTLIGEEPVHINAVILTRDTVFETETFQQELRIVSPGEDRFRYVAGVFYYNESYTIDQDWNLGSDYCDDLLPFLGYGALTAGCNAAPDGALVDTFGQELESLAAYAQGDLDITERVTLTGGLRWTRDDKTDGFFTCVSNNAAAALVGVPEDTQGLELTESKVTWLASAQYNPTDAVMLFVTASTGFKSGGFVSQAGSTRGIFNNEAVENYEVGAKATLAGGRVLANFTLFRMDLSGIQQRAFDSATTTFDTLNVGDLRQQGVEFEFNTRFVDQLSLSLSGAYLGSEYLDYPGAPGLPGQPPQDLTGGRNANSPEWTLAAASEWRDSLGGTNLDWFARGAYSYTDEQLPGGSYNPQGVRDAYTLVNAEIGLDSPKGWRASLFVNNAFDEGYCIQIIDQPLGGPLAAIDRTAGTSVQRCIVGAPRFWGARASYQF